MKKIAGTFTLLALLGASFASHAELTPISDGKLIYDSDLNITWLADANYSKTSGYNSSGLMTWNEANNNWASNLTFQGISNWRLPTVSEMAHLRSDLGGDNYDLGFHHNRTFSYFSNFQINPYDSLATRYWTSSEDPNHTINATTFDFSYGSTSFNPKDAGFYAMAVSPVPEPETYAMLLAGLGLLGWRTRNARN